MPDNISVSPKSEKKSFLSDIKEVVFFLGLYLIFSAWIYKYYFTNCFGIRISEVSTDLIDYLVYSFTVFWDHLILMPLILLLIYFILTTGKINNYLEFFLLLLIFPIIWRLADNTATTEATDVFKSNGKNLRTVSLAFKSDFFEKPKETSESKLYAPSDTAKLLTLEQNNDGLLKLLFVNNDGYYLFVHPKLNKNGAQPGNVVYYLNKDDINLTIIKN
jgi:hypothetical protein